MTDKPKTIRHHKAQKQHPLYFAFANAKSVAIELARVIAAEDKQNTRPDVQRFIEVFDKKTA